jgi:hypothetical protein
MITRELAKRAVEAELRSRNLTKPMTRIEMSRFCQEMHERLKFESYNDLLVDIRIWADRWQAHNLL